MAFLFFLFCSGFSQGDFFSGELEVRYEPKTCIQSPCPQFKVLKIDQEAMDNVGADIINLDPKKSSISAFRTVVVKGQWRWANDPLDPSKKRDYIEIKYSEWSAVVSEKAGDQ